MSMETANQLLKQLRDIKTGQVAKRPQPAVTAATPQAPQTPTQVQTQVQPPVSQQQQQPAAPYWQANQTVPQPDSLPPARYPEPRPAAPPTIPHSQSYNDSYGRTSSPSQQQQGAPRLSFESRPSFDTRPQDAAPAATGPLAPPPPRQQPARVPSPGASGYRPPVAAPVPMAGGRFQQQPVQAQPQQQQVYQPNAQQHYQPPAQQQVVRKRKIGLDDFNFLAVLGKGNFGKVMLAEERKSNNLYAIKVLKKEFIIENDEVESTQSEKRVFLAAAQERHPFLLGLHSCFQTETRVYFVMEYVSGGDLMLHIQRRQFTLRQAKFYACEVLLALQYFHSKDIIYRDLKLDNILLTLDGHVKVADYGLCKENMAHGKTTTTFCGTPEFMAPEILQEQPYSRAVDWWAFGVLTYEMLLGQSPFRGDDEDEIFDAILEDEPLYPLTMPKDAVSLLTELLTRDPKRRLGASVEDAEEIKRHAFFSDVNFDDVYHKRIPPPYFPTIGNATDTSNFDQEFTREQPTLTPVHTQLTAQDQQEFIGFSWVAPWAQ
jgi:classical protein kinase C/novel protein kinase C epsilon type